MNPEVELKLLKHYFDDALEAAIGDVDTNDLASKTAVLEKQLKVCRDLNIEFDSQNFESSIFYCKAVEKLYAKGFVEKTLRGSAADSSGLDAISLGLMAKGRESARVREATAYLGKSIEIIDDPNIRLFKASLHNAIGEKNLALVEVEHLLSNHQDNEDVYIEARKLRDEIEASREKCFIATAVYTPSGESKKLQLLRDYRDEVMANSASGRIAIGIYYRISPRIALILEKSNFLINLTKRLLLDPIVNWIIDSGFRSRD